MHHVQLRSKFTITLPQTMHFSPYYLQLGVGEEGKGLRYIDVGNAKV